MNYTERPDFYKYNHTEEENRRTKDRLTEISNLGMIEIGVAEFGIRGLCSGLYIEKVWNYNAEDWKSYIDWVKSLKR
jgi:hypothetical protein